MIAKSDTSKALRAKELGVSLRSFYYQQKKPAKDWQLKSQIEEVLREHPSYGHRRIAIHLHMTYEQKESEESYATLRD